MSSLNEPKGSINDTITDDISSEATILHADLDLGELTVLSSSSVDVNTKYTLSAPITTFGRERDNTIAFPDLAVSRYHFRIHKRGNEFTLEDISSGGTLINGKKYHNKSKLLEHGDKIQVGKSLLQFTIVGKPLEEGKASSSSFLIFFVVVVLLIASIGGFIFYRQMKKQAAARERISQAQQLYSSALRAFQKNQWKKTMNRCQEALALFPTNQLYLQCVTDARAALKAESTYKKALIFSKQDEKHRREALLLLDEIKDLVPPATPLSDRVWKLKFHLKEQLRKPVLPKPIPFPAGYSPRSGRCKRQKVNGWRVCIYIYQRDGKTWRYFFKRMRRKRRLIQILQKKGKKEPWLFYFDDDGQRVDLTKPQLSDDTRLKDPLFFYKRHQLFEAIELAKKQKKSNLVDRMKRFQHYYENGRRDYNGRRFDEAMTSLLEAHKLDKKLSQGKSAFSIEIRQMLANLHFIKGLFSMTRKEYPNAFEHFQKALKFLPSHKASKTKIKELLLIAQNWYEKAQRSLKESPSDQKARQLLKKIAKFISHQHPLYKKIQHLLQK